MGWPFPKDTWLGRPVFPGRPTARGKRSATGRAPSPALKLAEQGLPAERAGASPLTSQRFRCGCWIRVVLASGAAGGVQPPLLSQWVTPALLMSLLAFLVVDLRSSRVELRGDFRELQQDVQTAIGGGNTPMDGLSAEMKAGQQELNGRIDRLYQLLAPARQPDVQA